MALIGAEMPGCGTYNETYFSINQSTQWENSGVYVTGCGGGDIFAEFSVDNIEHVFYENSMGKITVKVTEGPIKRGYVYIYGIVNNNMTLLSADYMSAMNNHQLVFAIDEDLQYGYVNFWGQRTYYSPGSSFRNADNIQNNSYRNALYNFIKANVTYQWTSVPAISGKMGILYLTTADDSYHTGSDVSNIPLADVSITEPSKIFELVSGIPNGQTVSAIYAGSIDHIDITNSLFNYTFEVIVAHQTVFSTVFSAVYRASHLGFLIDDDQEVALMVEYRNHYEADILTGIDEIIKTASTTEMHNLWIFIHSHRGEEDDNPENNEPEEGTDDNYQPDIPITGITKPGYGAYDTGFTSQYRMADTQLKQLAQFLWSSSFVDNVKKFFNDPREIIVGLSIMPVLPDTGTAKEIKAGGISTGVSGLPLTDQYKYDTYGYADVKAEKGNFLDYNPFTKVTAHLPFVGEHSLDVNDVMGKSLTLKYIFDFLTGSCVAEIDVNGKPRYFFGGSCGIQIPTSSEDFGRMYSSIISAGATLGSTLATIATGGLTAPLMIGSASSMLANGMASSPTVQFSSGSGSVNGMIGCKTAFLVIEKPIEKIAAGQKAFVGKPSFMKKKLKSCSGFTKCISVHLDKVPCTSTEREEIERALINGVRIGTGSDTPSYTPTESGDFGFIMLKCLSDIDVIGKTWNTTETQTVEGKLLYDQNFLHPSLLLSGNFTSYNYVYIPAFGRFYFITEQIMRTGSLSELHLQVDSLQSFKEQLIGENSDIDVVLERQENLNNAYFADNMYWTQANKIVKTVPFLTAEGNELNFAIPADNFILTIAGGE